MTDANSPESQSESKIVSDDDWKSRVRAENAAMDKSGDESQASESAPENADAAATDSKEDTFEEIRPEQLPPANFQTMVGAYSSQAMVALGLIPHPSGEPQRPQLALAKHFIDMLGVLEDKTRNNLDETEAKMLETALHDLRMAYVQMSRQ